MSDSVIVQERPRERRPSALVREGAPADAGIKLAIHDSLSEVEGEWRRLEATADCTAFQTFDWLDAWCRQVGVRAGVRPAIVLGRSDEGEVLFVFPLAVTPGAIKRLTWLGSDLCDYN